MQSSYIGVPLTCMCDIITMFDKGYRMLGDYEQKGKKHHILFDFILEKVKK